MSATTVQTDLFGNPVHSWVQVRDKNTKRKHIAIRQRFDELYKQKRIRIDDVVEILVDEFFLSKITIERILRKR